MNVYNNLTQEDLKLIAEKNRLTEEQIKLMSTNNDVKEKIELMNINNSLTKEEIRAMNIISKSMSANNKVDEEQKNNINNNYNKFETINNKNIEFIKYFEVLTDGQSFWVSVEDIESICIQIPISVLLDIGANLDTDVMYGKTYLTVNEEFLVYVPKNTENPKYIPRLCLLKTKEYEYEIETKTNPKQIRELVMTVDGGIVEHIKTR